MILSERLKVVTDLLFGFEAPPVSLFYSYTQSHPSCYVDYNCKKRQL